MLFFVRDLLWSLFLPVCVLIVGLCLFVSLRFAPFRWMITAIRSLKDRSTRSGLSPFQTLTTVLSGTVGTGTIAGVAIAIKIGGPGTLFYMWLVAFFGMLIKYCEALLAMKFRRSDEDGAYYGGVMYYMEALWHDCPKIGAFFGVFYAVACMLSSLGIGASVQSYTLSVVLETSFHIPYYVTALVLMSCACLVVFGGVKRIALVAEFIVPLMIFVYLCMCVISLFMIRERIVGMLFNIVSCAIYGHDPLSLWVGSGIGVAIQQGVSRGIFTNEAGLGSSAFVQAASMSQVPLRQAAVSMVSTFIDTIIICTLTGLVILSVDMRPEDYGAGITIHALSHYILHAKYLISFCMLMFGFTTMLSWCYYGKIAASYIHPKLVYVFLMIWLLAIGYGCMGTGDWIWLYADLANAAMMLPNMLTLIVAIPVLKKWILTNA